jgi:hypothetical protein
MNQSLAAALVLAALAGPAAAPSKDQRAPYSSRLYYDAQKKCMFGSCDARTLERLKSECQRDGGRP